MSFAGFKKQLNKANQFVSEKIGGAEKTQYDSDFVEMERKVDATGVAVDEIITKTTEFLQPNPLTRAKLSTAHTVSKMRGQTKNSRYPQPEGNLGETFLKHGRELNEDSLFGNALLEAGEAYKQLADIKDNLDFNVKQNFLDPLEHLKQKELKEIAQHRKKMQGRRLDYDCKKRKVQKGSTIPEEEIRMAEEKFEESRDIVESGMRNLLESDVEQVRQLQALVDAQIEFHQQAQEILSQLTSALGDRVMEGENRPRSEFKPRKSVNTTLSSNSHNSDDSDNDSGVRQISYQPSAAPPAKSTKICKALYDFEAQNDEELPFNDGDIINLVQEIDENWLEGELNGKTGYFPRNYVEISTL
ncbi:endophilin-A2-like [Diadema antillarum]|uniref:endophilin-A2-like n=1 Tax=Diadema antillarum TaxID=105358 RepID=UPI003A86D15B